MIKIIEDNLEFKTQLENMITKDGSYIDLNMINSQNDKRSDRLGLNYALEELNANPNQTLVLYSFEQTQILYNDTKFMNIMAKSNSYFIRLPFSKKDLDTELGSLKFHNTALEIAGESEYKTSLRAILLHRIRSSDVISEIKKEFGFDGTDSEIVEKLRAYDTHDVEAKGLLPGVFVDIEGTLLKDDKINLPIVEMMIEYSKTRPVSIWTGGSRKDLTNKISSGLENAFNQFNSRVNNRIPIINKQMFEGYEPELVIDDLPQEQFEQDYKMKPKQYVKI